MPFALRWATEQDASAIKRLVRAEGLNPLGIEWGRFIVAEDGLPEGRRIVGIGQIKVHGDRSRELASIATVPDRRGEGIATAIVEALLKTNASASAGPLYLTCRSHNEKFYERFGFCRLTDPHGAPPYFRRMVRLINGVQAVGRVFGLEQRGMVMVRKGE